MDGPKEVDGVTKYRISWVDFPPESDTWEPPEHIKPADLQDYLNGLG